MITAQRFTPAATRAVIASAMMFLVGIATASGAPDTSWVRTGRGFEPLVKPAVVVRANGRSDVRPRQRVHAGPVLLVVSAVDNGPAAFRDPEDKLRLILFEAEGSKTYDVGALLEQPTGGDYQPAVKLSSERWNPKEPNQHAVTATESTFDPAVLPYIKDFPTYQPPQGVQDLGENTLVYVQIHIAPDGTVTSATASGQAGGVAESLTSAAERIAMTIRFEGDAARAPLDATIPIVFSAL